MRNILVITFYLIPSLAFAAVPDNYYNQADGKKGDALKQALHSVIVKHDEIDYGGLEPYYAKTDLDANDHIWDMYSTCTFTMNDANCSQKTVCQCWNKEHSVPSSWFKKEEPMYSDLFHVIPTDARVNNYRGNMPYGETSSTAYIAGSSHSLGNIGSSSFSGYSGTVFEPDDEYKGDFARNYFYMVTCYSTTNFTRSGDADAVFTYSNGKAELTAYAVNLFLKWHRQDPVSQKEIDRNNAVYGIQKNRNPFIDYPYLAEYIWGKKKDVNVNFATDLVCSSDSRFVPSVSDGSTASLQPSIMSPTERLHFPVTLSGMAANQKIYITGNKLTADVLFTLTGDKEMFDVSPASISVAKANTTNEITITYNPISVGNHTAVLNVSSEGVEPLQITLLGTCGKECNVIWTVNNKEYDGEADRKIAAGSTPMLIPADIESCSSKSESFVGWTAIPIEGVMKTEPDDLFTTADEAPVINTDTRFYAVFAHKIATAGSSVVIETADFSTGYNNAQEVTEKQMDNATVAFLQAEASLTAKYYNSSTSVRAYSSSQIKVTAPNIQKIVFAFGSKDHSNAISVNTGSFSNDTWTGLADEVVFTIGGTSGYRSIQKITVTSQEVAEQHIYTDFITACETTTDEKVFDENTIIPSVRKVMIDGHLYLQTENGLYNANGQKVN